MPATKDCPMLEFGNAPAETTPNDLIKDTTEAE
ncbi:MAG: hypothetical protein ACI9VX_001503, partial [Dinoroseobacter sp.]